MTSPVHKAKTPAPVDPVVQAFADAPDDDEPVTADEAAAIAEGLADVDRGDVIRHDELKRQLGL